MPEEEVTYQQIIRTEIITDETLPNNSVLKGEGDRLTITGGTVAGNNLFHSFEQFNIAEGQTVTFTSPDATIQNIFIRVTGSRPEILGTVATPATSQPNLFLLNSKGAVFESKASLDIGGSFVTTTASAIQFDDLELFSTSKSLVTKLSESKPSAFLFEALVNPGEIINRSNAKQTASGFVVNGAVDRSINGLQVLEGRSLLLVGGNLTLERGQLWALNGRIELASLAGSGTVGLVTAGETLSLDFLAPESTGCLSVLFSLFQLLINFVRQLLGLAIDVPTTIARANISLTKAFVNTTASGKGSVAVTAKNLNLGEGSIIQAGISKDSRLEDNQAGDIIIDATETIVVTSGVIQNNVQPGGAGKAGKVLVSTQSLSLQNNANLSASTHGDGDANEVIVQVRNRVSLLNNSAIFCNAYSKNSNAGNVRIKARSVNLEQLSSLNANSFGSGNAGQIIVQADDALSLSQSFIFAVATPAEGPSGAAGTINLQTMELSLANGSELFSRAVDGRNGQRTPVEIG